MSEDFNDLPERWTVVTNSSNILAIQYTAGDPLADLGMLRIRFQSGAEYFYDKVPNQLAVDFFESESKGKFFHANISRVYEGVRNLNNELQADLEKRVAELGPDLEDRLNATAKEASLDKLLENAPVPEDVPIGELFNEVAEDLPAELPVPYRERA